MFPIKINDMGDAVEDVQRRLAKAGLLASDKVTGVYNEATAQAVAELCRRTGIEVREEVDDVVWPRLVDASFELGDRSLYLTVPFYHGHDVETLQHALSALGFNCGTVDGIFGAHTEDALRRFQLNMGLPNDGIAGALTFRALDHLRHSWEGKGAFNPVPNLGFARASEVLESHYICLFGTGDFTRAVAARMSNLALATNPLSKITSADALLVEPDAAMVFIQILVADEQPTDRVPIVEFTDDVTLAPRLAQALQAAEDEERRVAVRLPGEMWEDAGAARSAQHYAIALLDALCSALEL